MRPHRPTTQHVMGRFPRPRGRRLQAALTLVLLLTLVGGVGALALSRQPAAQAEVSADATGSYFEGAEVSLTDDGGEHRDLGEGATEVRTPETETETVQEQHVTDAARLPGQAGAPPTDEATPPLVVAQADPKDPADTATVGPPDLRTPAQQTDDADAAAELAAEKARVAEEKAKAAQQEARQARYQAYRALDDAIRAGRIEEFMFREGKMGVTGSREQAATAVDAGQEQRKWIDEGISAANQRVGPARAVTQNKSPDSAERKALDITTQGLAAMKILREGTVNLAGAEALGLNSGEALHRTREAAVATVNGISSLTDAVFSGIPNKPPKSKEESLNASRAFSEAANLALSAGQQPLSGEFDPSEISKRPGASTIPRATELSLKASERLIEAARLSATVFHSPSALLGYPAAVKEALEAAKQAETAHNKLKSNPPLGVQPAAPASGSRP
jgi:hypothetical protein